MRLKEAFLNKGWAGKTLSRKQTAERINPLIQRHYELNHAYNFAINQLDDAPTVQELNFHQKIARADIGKLSETVLSAGEPSYNGIDLEPEDFAIPGDDVDILRELERRESEFGQLLDEELRLEHQIRTRAILQNVRANSSNRLDLVRDAARKLSRTAAST